MIKLNGEKFESTKFPNGELLVDLKGYTKEIQLGILEVDYYFDSNESLIELMLIKKEVDYINPKCNCILTIRYMPYSRMDRRIGSFSFSLKYISDFINSLKFNRVIVYEEHSSVTTILLENSYSEYKSIDVLVQMLNDFEFDINKDYIVFPDAGAEKKYLDKFSKDIKYVIGFKKRNLETGKIISFDIVGDLDMNSGRAFIVDDLCSRGGTFLATATKLKERNCGDVLLAVTHLENNVNTGDIFKTDLIKYVYATNSIYTGIVHDKLKIVEV